MSNVQKCTTWKDNRFSIWYIDNENEEIKCAKIIIPRPSLTLVDGEYVGGKMMGYTKSCFHMQVCTMWAWMDQLMVIS